MLPSDITGVSIFNQVVKEFEYRSGPIMAQIVLVDEINRATPKTQSALLEAMQERQVTVDGVTHPLPRPFMVLATQNPIEYEGTFPLPEAQMDRFFFRIRLGYPDLNDEVVVLDRQQYQHPLEALEIVKSVEQVFQAQKDIQSVFVAPAVKRYMVEIVRNTRMQKEVYLGASPRGSLALYRSSQAWAAVQGRDFVIPDDVKAVAGSALAHRLILGPGVRLREIEAEDIIKAAIGEVAVPGGRYKQ
jgi:MoxR-like ATPase